MKLRVEDITAEAKELAFAEPQADVNRVLDEAPAHEFHLCRPIGVRLSYYRAGMELFFEGELDAPIAAVCARCAEEFTSDIRRRFRFVLAPRALGADETSDLGEEDLEFSTYEGEGIDLTPLIREQLLLALPTRPLCSDSCRGLCPRCGANLNNAQCKCAAETGDPRLAPLKGLRERLSS